MPKNNDRAMQDFSKYDAMTSEELAKLLRLDSEAPEGNELDIDTWFYVTGVLAERKKISNNTGKTAQEAWNSFQQDYLPVEEDLAVSANTTKSVKGHPWVRRAVAAAAAVALIVCVPLTAKALNWEKIWNAVAMWAKETFSFVSDNQEEHIDPAPKDTNQYQSLQEAVNSNFTNPVHVPSWVPNGYEFDEVRTHETPNSRQLIACYLNKGSELIIQVKTYLITDPQRTEIKENLIEIYEVSGTKYYIFANNDQLRGVWLQDSYECYISGEITIEEMKQMIDSIPKG